jgi:hypothetical protein
MSKLTFAESVSAIAENTEMLSRVAKVYPADNLQNLRNILYVIDRISLLTDGLLEQVEADLAKVANKVTA